MRYERKHAIIILVLVLVLLAMNLSPSELQGFRASAFTKATRIGFGVGNLTFIVPSNGSNISSADIEFNPNVQFTESNPKGSIETGVKPSDSFPMLAAMVLLLFTYCAALYVNRDLKTSEICNMNINHQI